MGSWGVGLYSGDDALDLRGAIRAVCQLPHDGDALVELLGELNPDAQDPNSEGHSTFWLVVADQFQRRGIRSVAQKHALEIIADGSDLAMLEKLGMTAADLRKRKRLLELLAEELRSPLPEKPRKTLKKPQPVLFNAGDVLAYQIDDCGNCRNPYDRDEWLANFKPVGWDGCAIVASGLALEYLAWYQIIPTRAPWKDRPTLANVLARLDPPRARVGTMSKRHVARMHLEPLGISVLPKVSPPSKQVLVWTTAQNIGAGNVLSRWLGRGGVKIE
jgi:hypothetical protein